MKFSMCVLIGMGSICIVFGGWVDDDRGDPKNGNFSTSLGKVHYLSTGGGSGQRFILGAIHYFTIGIHIFGV